MTDTKIQELIDKACGAPSKLTEMEIFELGGIAAKAHEDLARIKGAALSVPGIAARHEHVARTNRPEDFSFGERVAHADRATLLDALRAVTVELNDATRDRDTFSALNRTAEEERDEAREALRAKEAEILSLEASLQYGRDAIQASVDGENEARAQLAQAQKEIERLNAGWNDALAQRDKIDAYFAKVRSDLGALMGWTSSKPGKVPSVPGLEAQARTIKRLADQASPEISNLWKMVSAAVGDGWKTRMTTGYSMAMALCAEISDIKEKLAQAERDKAAMRERIEGLTRLWVTNLGEEVEHETGHLLRRSEVLALFDAQPQGNPFAVKESGAFDPQPGLALPPGNFMMGDGSVVDTRAVGAEKGQESKAEWLSELERLDKLMGAPARPDRPTRACWYELNNLRYMREIASRESAVSLADLLSQRRWPQNVALYIIDAAGSDILAAHRDVKTGDTYSTRQTNL